MKTRIIQLIIDLALLNIFVFLCYFNSENYLMWLIFYTASAFYAGVFITRLESKYYNQ